MHLEFYLNFIYFLSTYAISNQEKKLLDFEKK